MPRSWQKIFLTWGILIAVFGMRLVFPIADRRGRRRARRSRRASIDSGASTTGLYAENLEEAQPDDRGLRRRLPADGVPRLLLRRRKDHWLGPIERPIAGVGASRRSPRRSRPPRCCPRPASSRRAREDVLSPGLAGLVAYLVVSGVAERLEPDDDEDEEEEGGRRGAAAPIRHGRAAPRPRPRPRPPPRKGGLRLFLYLEVLDASFSFDGVIGAFAISKDIIVIAVGLGLGALYIRTLTVYLVRQGTLAEYRYLEHGAHWAIGVLAVLLFIGAEFHVPEVITGTIGALLIIAAFFSSLRANRDEDGSERRPRHPDRTWRRSEPPWASTTTSGQEGRGGGFGAARRQGAEAHRAAAREAGRSS